MDGAALQQRELQSGVCGKPSWGNGALRAPGSSKPRPGAGAEPGCSLQAGRAPRGAFQNREG